MISVFMHLQDTIPRGGKFFSAYKRNGQRVVVNKIGDIVVRPTPLEASMLQAAWGSNPLHHLLQSYQVCDVGGLIQEHTHCHLP